MTQQNKASSKPKKSDDPILETHALTKRFPLVVANNEISLTVRRGEIHCLLGENGAGKSTLAGCIYGFHLPDAGEIRFKGKSIKVSSPRDAINLGIGMVHQHFVLIQPHSVIENIVLGVENPGLFIDFHTAEEKLKDLCEAYDLRLNLDANISQLSVGEQQWVEILKTLYLDAELLILDEPTSVLTPQESRRLFSVIERMRDDGLSIIFITHKLNEVMSVSDRVSVLRKGSLIATMDTRNVTKEQLAKTMVGRSVVFNIEKEDIPRGDPVLTISNLYVKDSFDRDAVRNLSLTLHSREILGIAGVAGNGQRELADVLIGARKLKSGQIILGDNDISDKPTRDIMALGVSFIPQDRLREGLIQEFSVAENMILGFQDEKAFSNFWILSSNLIQNFAKKQIGEFEIVTPSPNHKTRFLSGGNLQKVILARELARNPKVLIANQPTRGLDVGAIEYVHTRLIEQKKSGVGILLISEDLDEIFTLADRIAVIFKGEIMDIYRSGDASIDEIGLRMAGVKEGIA